MSRPHPAFAELLASTSGKSVLADSPLAEVRAFAAARAASRRGPDLEDIRDLVAPGPRGPLSLRLYRPAHASGVVVAFHGGGWMMGGLDTFDATCRWLAKLSGAAILSVDYRLAPEFPFPAAVEDAWAATLWAAEHAAGLGVPAGRLAVLGESAGGNLAAVVALKARDEGAPLLARQILIYPAVDALMRGAAMETFADGFFQTKRDVEHAWRAYALKDGADPRDARLSPLHAASHQGVAPALILSAELDAIRDDSAAYAERLLAAGVPTVHVRYEGMIHTFFAMRGGVDAAAAAQAQVAAEIAAAFAKDREI